MGMSLSKVLCERRVENPYYRYLYGEAFFLHRLMFDRFPLTRWRQRMDEDELKALLQESLAVAVRADAFKPSELSRVIVDTTAQPKNVMFQTDARLLHCAREILVRMAAKHGVHLR
jgi:IS5 family transposase